jgi:3-methyladenine DNA glycosylase AlkC
MAEPLRNHFDDRVPRAIAAQLAAVWPAFPADGFLADVLGGYDGLGLMDRGRRIARVLRARLPGSYPEALSLLLRSVGDRPGRTEGDGGMASFRYLPHVFFVAEYGLDDFAVSMRAQHLLTRLFTAEFSIRPFLERYPDRTLAVLREWTADPDPHVRRLVSEGTRPRLPWASRLRRFQQDPAPVLELLELLKDDPDPMVRRSVANNLNDIGKDHPERLVRVLRLWMTGASDARRGLVRHALRSLVKQGHPGALAILGAGERAAALLEVIRIEPRAVAMGDSVTIAVGIRSTSASTQRLLADLRVHFVKASGASSPKVFKLAVTEVAPGALLSCRKTVSLGDLSTRRHYPGVHEVELLLNGRALPLGSFTVSG